MISAIVASLPEDTLMISGTVLLCVTADGPRILSSNKMKARSSFKYNPILSYAYDELSID